jgi:hypothetical protein
VKRGEREGPEKRREGGRGGGGYYRWYILTGPTYSSQRLITPVTPRSRRDSTCPSGARGAAPMMRVPEGGREGGRGEGGREAINICSPQVLCIPDGPLPPPLPPFLAAFSPCQVTECLPVRAADPVFLPAPNPLPPSLPPSPPPSLPPPLPPSLPSPSPSIAVQ